MRLKLTFVILIAICIAYVSCDEVESGINECGVQSSHSDSGINSFPWLVALLRRPIRKFFCSGSLISEKHVLSAAHCFVTSNDEEEPAKIEPYEVMCWLGKFNLTDQNEEKSVKSLVSEIVVPQNWNSTNWRVADIAIVVLMESIKFTKTIQPICLPQVNEASGVGTVVGWGRSEASEFEHFDDTPSHFEIPTVEESSCFSIISDQADHLPHGIFCGGNEKKSKASCLVDSAGKLYHKSSSNNAWSVNGIVTGSSPDSEHGCDISGFHLYTNVADFIDWITKVMKETKEMTWKFVDVACELHYRDVMNSECTSSYKGPWTQNLKFRSVYSHQLYFVPYQVELTLKIQGLMLNGVGESFPKLRTIYFENIDDKPLVSLERRHFQNMSNLKYLALDEVDCIAEDAFDDLTNLEKISFYFNGESTAETLLVNLLNLKQISLRNTDKNNGSLTIGEVYQDLENLESITFYLANFKKLERSSVANLFRVKNIDLDACGIDEIVEDAFQNLTSIEDLSLASNQFENLAEQTFWNLKTLVKLNLSNNTIEFIPSKAFRDLTNLVSLDLSRLKIKSVDENLFKNLEKLTKLYLTNNPIVAIHENVFKPLVNLEYVILGFCKIESVPAGLFEHNLKLKEVDLGNNRLNFIEIDFTKMSKLIFLNLGENSCISATSYFGEIPLQEVQNIIVSNCTQL